MASDNLPLILETISGEPNPQDKQLMSEGMLKHHASQGHPRKTNTFSILLKDSNGILKGVVVASILWNGMHIDTLWVDVTIRNQKWGSKLMKLVEKEGRSRGATVAYTDTFTWQAPGFYEKMGYSLYGKIDNFPPGNSLSYFSKIIG